MRAVAWISMAAALALAACAYTTHPMTAGPQVPGAQGTVSTAEDDDGSTRLKVHVEHLAPPGKVSADAAAYVVWVRPRGQTQWQSIGALELGENGKGRLDTRIPYRNLEVAITPEKSAAEATPSGPIVLRTVVQGAQRAPGPAHPRPGALHI